MCKQLWCRCPFLAAFAKWNHLEFVFVCICVVAWRDSEYSPVSHTFGIINRIGLDGESNSIIAKYSLYGLHTRIPQPEPLALAESRNLIWSIYVHVPHCPEWDRVLWCTNTEVALCPAHHLRWHPQSLVMKCAADTATGRSGSSLGRNMTVHDIGGCWRCENPSPSVPTRSGHLNLCQQLEWQTKADLEGKVIQDGMNVSFFYHIDLFKMDAQVFRLRHNGLSMRFKNLKDSLLPQVMMVIGKTFRTPVFQWTLRLLLLLKEMKSSSYRKFPGAYCIECVIYLYWHINSRHHHWCDTRTWGDQICTWEKKWAD